MTTEAPWYITVSGEAARRQRRAVRRQQERDREDAVFAALARGATWLRIAEEAGMDRRLVPALVARVLERRRDELTPTMERARAVYLARLNVMVETLMARFTSAGVDDDGNPMPVDTRAGELLLKVLNQIAAETGGKSEAKPVEIDLTVRNLNDSDKLQARVLADLAQVAAKQRVIDGELAIAGTDLAQLTGAEDPDDTPPPPAIGAP